MTRAVLPALIGVLALAGCATTTVADATYQGTPPGYEGESNLLNGVPLALWGTDREVVAVVTFGRSSCPPVPTAISAPDAQTIVIDFKASAEQCSGELEPTTHEFTVPGNVDADGVVVAELRFGEQAYEVEVE